MLKRIRLRKLIVHLFTVFYLVTFIPNVFANDGLRTPELKPVASQSKPPQNFPGSQQGSEISLDLVDTLKKQNSKLEKKIDVLETELRKQIKLIEALKSNEDSMDYAQWSSIMLASVALILTVLGIVLAVFSFIGYQKVLDSAKTTATDVAGREVENKIHDTTKLELEKLFSKQAMSDSDSNEYKKLEPIRKFLLDAVAKVIYRGISFEGYDSNSSDKEQK